MSEPGGRRFKRSSESRNQAAGQRGCTRDADLLAENGADAQFEGIPRAGNAQPGAGGDQRSEQGIGAEARCDGERIGVQIEDAPHTGDDRQQVLGPRVIDFQNDLGIPVQNLNEAGDAAERDHPAVNAIGDALHAGNGARGQECQESGPIEGRTIAQPELQAGSSGQGASLALLAWAAAPGPAEDLMEAAHAAESGGRCNCGDGQVRFIEQTFGREQAVGLSHRHGRRTEMLDKEPAEMPIADAEPAGKTANAGVVEGALANFAKRPDDGGGSSVPWGRPRRAFGPAPKARAQSGGYSGGRGRVVIDVLLAWGTRGADGPAKDPGRADADEEAAVEARVAG